MTYTDGKYLISDESPSRLVDFARAIGIEQRRLKETLFPHFELHGLEFRKALDKGAILVPSNELLSKVKR